MVVPLWSVDKLVVKAFVISVMATTIKCKSGRCITRATAYKTSSKFYNHYTINYCGITAKVIKSLRSGRIYSTNEYIMRAAVT
jgi:hypothetical protein